MHEAAKLVRREELMRLLLCGLVLKEKSNEIYKRLDAELASSKEDMQERLERASEEALEMMIEMARTSTSIVKMKCLQDLMDRDGRISRTQRVQSDVKHD